MRSLARTCAAFLIPTCLVFSAATAASPDTQEEKTKIAESFLACIKHNDVTGSPEYATDERMNVYCRKELAEFLDLAKANRVPINQIYSYATSIRSKNVDRLLTSFEQCVEAVVSDSSFIEKVRSYAQQCNQIKRRIDCRDEKQLLEYKSMNTCSAQEDALKKYYKTYIGMSDVTIVAELNNRVVRIINATKENVNNKRQQEFDQCLLSDPLNREPLSESEMSSLCEPQRQAVIEAELLRGQTKETADFSTNRYRNDTLEKRNELINAIRSIERNSFNLVLSSSIFGGACPNGKYKNDDSVRIYIYETKEKLTSDISIAEDLAIRLEVKGISNLPDGEIVNVIMKNSQFAKQKGEELDALLKNQQNQAEWCDTMKARINNKQSLVD